MSGGCEEDVFVKLARENVDSFVRTGKKINLPSDLPLEMTNRAGVFVSIKKNGQLRGCIGTIAPTQSNIGQEILQNSISAAAYDPRFSPITSDELKSLVISVDVLFPPEHIKDKSELNVLKYGVIVSFSGKHGLLLPNLEGVDTVEKQISIALQKGGILPDEPYTMERFEVVRHK
jgi:AmmeMemoRadiSam system protein A